MKDTDTKKNLVLVVGSANMDLVVSCDSFPKPGETILGGEFGMYPGGKGANQAVACAKLGGNVRFLAKMGQDVFQENLFRSLKRDGVIIDDVIIQSEKPTGIALITVDHNGENEIIVVSGSNMTLSPEEVVSKQRLFEGTSVVLLQLEIPLETVREAITIGRSHGTRIILNPAPARKLPEALLSQVDYLTPNETEAEILSGIKVHDEASAEKAARALLEQGVGHVILTLGDKGALLVTQEERLIAPAHTVPTVVDTTAAGDAFNGALAFAIAGGYEISDALALANSVAAFSVTKKGAQTSMPTWADLNSFRSATNQTSIEIEAR